MIRRWRIFPVLLPAVLLLFQGTYAQQLETDVRTSRHIAGEILLHGRSLDYERDLTDKFGGRLTGSASYQKAAEWAAESFRAAGLKNVRLEPFGMPSGWERGWGHGRIITPVERPLHIQSLGWAPSTPKGGVRSELFIARDISSENLKSQAVKTKDHIVILDLSALRGGFDSFARIIEAINLLKELDAQALVISDREANDVLNAFSLNRGGEMSPLPIAQVGMEDGKTIMRLAEKGPVRIEFEYENKISGPIQVSNVIAEIPGREKPEEWILIGAHLDSWDYGTGAQDNGTGAAMVLEAARAIASLGQAPRRTIRFALWGGEEQGLLGSTAYVKAHISELENCVAALNTDNGAGHPKGWKVEGRGDVAEGLKPLSETILEGMGAGMISQETTYDTDHGPFMLTGIPALDLLVDESHYGEVHHKASDTFDKVDPHNLADGAAVVAVTAYNIAESSAPLAKHLDHSGVAEILKKANLDAFLTSIGVWK